MSSNNWLLSLCTLCIILLISPAALSFTVPTVVYGEYKTIQTNNDINSVLFLGDVMLARHVASLGQRFGTEYSWLGLDFSIFPNTTVVANFEAAIPEQYIPTPVGSLTFAVPRSAIPVLYNVGIEYVSLANNHSNDFGESGYKQTLETLNQFGVVPFGTPYSFINEQSWRIAQVGDKKVALVGLYLLESTPEVEALQSLIDTLQTQSDFQVAFVHWGTEYETSHSNQQETQAKQLVDAGFDLIIGHHPHVVQDIGLVDGVPVLYSLGNYIFDQYFSPDVLWGLITKLSFTEDEFQITLHPVESLTNLSQPQLLLNSERTAVLETIAAHSALELRDEIAAGTLAFPLQSR